MPGPELGFRDRGMDQINKNLTLMGLKIQGGRQIVRMPVSQ